MVLSQLLLIFTLLVSFASSQTERHIISGPVARNNMALSSCAGQTYVTRYQICCDGQIWEDPYGLYTCCGRVPCLTDVGVSVYQVFQGKYTDGVSQFIGGRPGAPVRLPPGALAIQFSRTPMGLPPYFVYKGRRGETIPVISYPLPPPRRHRIQYIPMPVQQGASEIYRVGSPSVSYVPANSISAVSPVVTQADDETEGKKIPEFTIRIEAEPAPNRNGNNLKHLTNEAAKVDTNKAEEVIDASAELLRILDNIEPIADVVDETTTKRPRLRQTGRPKLVTSTTTTAAVPSSSGEGDFEDLIDLLDNSGEVTEVADRQQPASSADNKTSTHEQPVAGHQVIPFWNPHIPPPNEYHPPSKVIPIAPIAFQSPPTEIINQPHHHHQEPAAVEIQPVTYVVEVPNEPINNEITRRHRRRY